MKHQKTKLTEPKNALQNTLVGSLRNEIKFNDFIKSCLDSRESIDSYINSAIRNGKSRRQATIELNSMGVYLKDIQ
jgi:hypothetical protein